MPITKLSNEQIQTVVNTAYAQFTGSADLSTALDLSKFNDPGNKDITADRERFTGALLGVLIKNWYTDSSYRSEYVDDFYEDSAQFGAILQAISAEMPHAKENAAWQNFVSGVSTVGVYTVYLPVIDANHYAKSTSWALPITITGEQWDSAFHNQTELDGFVAYLWLCLDNAIVQHLEDMNAENRNAFIAQKIEAANDGVAGVHVVDLVAGYVADRGISTAFSASDFLTTEDSLLYMAEQIDLYAGYTGKQTTLFNTEGKVRFTPEERRVVQVIEAIAKRLDVVARSGVYHKELVSLPRYREVAAWQSMESLDLSDLTSINVTVAKTDGTTATVSQSYIVAMIADKWAIMHTIISERVASQRFDIENLTHYEYQHRDKYMTNLSMNGIVFVLNDYTPGP